MKIHAVSPKAAKKFLREKELKEKKQNSAACQIASQDAHKIIEYIIAHFNPLRIYQWGSLIYPDRFNQLSDIDIALEGINAAQDFFDILIQTENMTQFSLDIVQLEKIHPLHAQSIREKGNLVYERKK